VNLLYSLYLTVNPAPIEGDLKPGLEEGDITPGLLGFLATLFLALCVVFLIRDMVKRIRRVRYRAQAAGDLSTDGGAGTTFPVREPGTAGSMAETDQAGSADTAGKRAGQDTAG